MARKIIQTIEFNISGTFKSLWAAEAWCHENGYTYGSLCCNQPVAIVRGEYNLPQKWKNISTAGRRSTNGVMLSNDFREGKVLVRIYE